MVSISPDQAFLNIGKNPKTASVSKYCRKSRGNTPGDRQFQKDCHTLQDGSRRTPGHSRKGYCSTTRTLRIVGTAHNSIPDTGETFLNMEGFYCSIFLLIFQIKGFKDLEANPKDSGNETRRLLDKPLSYPPDPLDGRVLFFFVVGDAGRLKASFPSLGVKLYNVGR